MGGARGHRAWASGMPPGAGAGGGGGGSSEESTIPRSGHQRLKVRRVPLPFPYSSSERQMSTRSGADARAPSGDRGGGGDRKYGSDRGRDAYGSDRGNPRVPSDSRYRGGYDAPAPRETAPREARGYDRGPGGPSMGRGDRRYRVSLSGLPEHYTWRELKDFLRAGAEGNVMYANVTRPGLGIGEFVSLSEQSAAIRNLDGKSVEGCTVRCRIAEDEVDGRGAPPFAGGVSSEREVGGGYRGGGYGERGYDRDMGGRGGVADKYARDYEAPKAYDRATGGYMDAPSGGGSYYSGGGSYGERGYDERSRYPSAVEGGRSAGYGSAGAAGGSYAAGGSNVGYGDTRGRGYGSAGDPGYSTGVADVRGDAYASRAAGYGGGDALTRRTGEYSRYADRTGDDSSMGYGSAAATAYDTRSAGRSSYAEGYAGASAPRGADDYYGRSAAGGPPSRSSDMVGRGGPDRSYGGSRSGRTAPY
eukprot:gene17848-24235_t